MNIYAPNNYKAPRIGFDASLEVQDINLDDLSNFADEVVAIEDKKINTIKTNYDNILQAQQDVTGIKLNSAYGRKVLEQKKESLGINENLYNISLDDLKNPFATRKVQSTLNSLVTDPEITALMQEQKIFEDYDRKVKQMARKDDPMATVFQNDLNQIATDASGSVSVMDIDPNDYQRIDFTDLMMSKLDELPAGMSVRTAADGSFEIFNPATGVVITEDEFALGVAEEFSDSPLVQNNLRAQIDPNKPEGERSIEDPDAMDSFLKDSAKKAFKRYGKTKGTAGSSAGKSTKYDATSGAYSGATMKLLDVIAREAPDLTFESETDIITLNNYMNDTDNYSVQHAYDKATDTHTINFIPKKVNAEIPEPITLIKKKGVAATDSGATDNTGTTVDPDLPSGYGMFDPAPEVGTTDPQAPREQVSERGIPTGRTGPISSNNPNPSANVTKFGLPTTSDQTFGGTPEVFDETGIPTQGLEQLATDPINPTVNAQPQGGDQTFGSREQINTESLPNPLWATSIGESSSPNVMKISINTGATPEISTANMSPEIRDLVSTEEILTPSDVKKFSSRINTPEELVGVVLKSSNTVFGSTGAELPVSDLMENVPTALEGSKVVVKDVGQVVDNNKADMTERESELLNKFRTSGLNNEELDEYNDLYNKRVQKETVKPIIVPEGMEVPEAPITLPIDAGHNEPTAPKAKPVSSGTKIRKAYGGVKPFQRLLKQRGYYQGGIDAAWGPGTAKGFEDLKKDVQENAAYYTNAGIKAASYLLGGGDNDITEKSISSSSLELLRDLAMRKGGGLDKGYVTYDDIRKGTSAEGETVDSYWSSLKSLGNTDVINLSTLLGNFNVIETPDGEVYVFDSYDFNDASGSDSEKAYNDRIAGAKARGEMDDVASAGYSKARAAASGMQVKRNQQGKRDPVALIYLGKKKDLEKRFKN